MTHTADPGESRTHGPRVGWLCAILATAALLAGCDRHTDWPEPAETLPGWVYDAPFYYEPLPQDDLFANEIDWETQAPHLYTSSNVLVIRRPEQSNPQAVPRLAVYWSNDHGRHWHKGGYFGIDADYFTMPVPSEGLFRIRFVGPGFAPARQPDNVPGHRIYHVDWTSPTVTVQVTPFAQTYGVGQQVELNWTTRDANLADDQTATIYHIEPDGRTIELGRDFPANGQATVHVPSGAASGGVQFAVEVTDKPGNVGRGYSFRLQTTQAPPPASQPDVGLAERMDRQPGREALSPPAIPGRTPEPSAPSRRVESLPVQPNRAVAPAESTATGTTSRTLPGQPAGAGPAPSPAGNGDGQGAASPGEQPGVRSPSADQSIAPGREIRVLPLPGGNGGPSESPASPSSPSSPRSDSAAPAGQASTSSDASRVDQAIEPSYRPSLVPRR